MNARITSVVVVILVNCTAAIAQEKPEKDVRQSVVRVFATVRLPDMLQPWNKQPPQQTAGSGVVIDGERILTSAHLVGYASQVFVMPYQSGQRVPAKVERIAPGMDLAALKVDSAFFKNRPPLELADGLPDVKDAVTVYGYPVGGTSLSITKGIVSRIEFGQYRYGEMGLRVQIDAALNPGNSGGAAMVNDKLVGVVFGVFPQGQNIGFVVPSEEISTFLNGDAADALLNKPQVFDDLQALENAALRAKLALPAEVTGVLVSEPYATDAEYPLKKADVITRIGDYAIGNDGMVDVKENLRLAFAYLVPKLARDGKVPFTVVRGDRTETVSLPVLRDRNTVLKYLKGNYPSYFVYGPVVFMRATASQVDGLAPHLSTDWSFRRSPLLSRRDDLVSYEGEELVVVSELFPHKISEGYTDPGVPVVSHINDVPVKNLRHLAETLRAATEQYIVIRFADKHIGTLVFDREELLTASDDILNDNGIRQAWSSDLNDVWREKK